MDRVLKAAVVGAGHLGKHHARILAGTPGVELVGVVDAVPAAAAQVAGLYGAKAFTRHEELYGKVDAAVVAAPTRLHFQIGMDLLQKGVHLLVEKPLAASFVEAWQLVEAARARGLVLAVGHVERFNPAWKTVLTRCQEPGRQPKYIEANRLGTYTCRSTDIGVVLDLMIHDLDLVLSLVRQPVERIEALGMSIFGKHEDVANARLTFAGGCTATLTASRASFTARRDMQLWTPTQFIGVDFATRVAKVVEPSEQLLSRQLDVDALSPQEKESFRQNLFTEHLRTTEVPAEACDQLTAELTDFLDAIRGAGAPRCEGREACTAIAVAERILSKLQTHSWDGTTTGLRGPHFPSAKPVAATGWTKPAHAA